MNILQLTKSSPGSAQRAAIGCSDELDIFKYYLAQPSTCVTIFLFCVEAVVVVAHNPVPLLVVLVVEMVRIRHLFFDAEVAELVVAVSL